MDLEDFFKFLSNGESRNDVIMIIVAVVAFTFISIMVLGQMETLINSYF